MPRTLKRGPERCTPNRFSLTPIGVPPINARMIAIPEVMKPIGTATAANIVGRSANVAIALTVITRCGADNLTDQFFLNMAIAFFFFGPVSNAVTTATTPLLISGKLDITSRTICLAGVSCTALLCTAAVCCNHLSGYPAPVYILAIALMSGAGVANGLATGIHYAQESFFLPGVTWSLRLIPLLLMAVAGSLENRLAWLAVGIGLADWLRLGILVRGPIPSRFHGSPHALRTLVRTFPSYGKVIAASVIMGLNPIIDRMIAGLSGPGAVSILEAGERIYMMLASVGTIGLMSVLLTRLSHEVAGNELNANWSRTIRLAAVWNGFWILIGAAVGYWGLAWWLEASAPLTSADAQVAQQVFWCYLSGLPAFALGLTYLKRLQALQRWWVMVGASVLSVAINIPASLILRQWMGVPGIALATTLTSIINCGVLITAAHTVRSR